MSVAPHGVCSSSRCLSLRACSWVPSRCWRVKVSRRPSWRASRSTCGPCSRRSPSPAWWPPTCRASPPSKGARFRSSPTCSSSPSSSSNNSSSNSSSSSSNNSSSLRPWRLEWRPSQGKHQVRREYLCRWGLGGRAVGWRVLF